MKVLDMALSLGRLIAPYVFCREMLTDNQEWEENKEEFIQKSFLYLSQYENHESFQEFWALFLYEGILYRVAFDLPDSEEYVSWSKNIHLIHEFEGYDTVRFYISHTNSHHVSFDIHGLFSYLDSHGISPESLLIKEEQMETDQVIWEEEEEVLSPFLEEDLLYESVEGYDLEDLEEALTSISEY